ncbi:MAG TPA: AarF/ABC1/UbiB kinase family protein [Caulobacterales bacterium]|nr:AarF/ABC1/UbiB kinase family protein [Caulobacterales bacterium]
MADAKDPERNRLSARIGRTAKLGANLSGAAATYGAARLFGGDQADAQIAAALRLALGRSKGPLMKIAQMLASIPDLLPPEYAREMGQLMANAPAMGWPFVQRRMRAELGADWERKFGSFEKTAAAAASLGQVHRATAKNGALLACKLQYPDMASAVESDLSQLQTVLGLIKRVGKGVDPSEIGKEMAERLREELDYERERKHIRLFARMLESVDGVALPEPIEELSTKRLLTMRWLEGKPLKSFLDAPLETRNRIAAMLFRAWWTPVGQYGIIHGDPHLGNYTLSDDAERLNLLDFGCVRIFPPRFIEGVIKLRSGLEHDDRALIEEAYTLWGFTPLRPEIIDTLNIWARFLYAPLLDRRVRAVTAGVEPSEYGRREIREMKQKLFAYEAVTIPREFVFLDRAVIGLGAAFLHLKAELNFAELFDECIAGFSTEAVAARQANALKEAGLA